MHEQVGRAILKAEQQKNEHENHTDGAQDSLGAPSVLEPRILHYQGSINPTLLESVATRPAGGTSQPAGTRDKEGFSSSSHDGQWEASTRTAFDREGRRHQPQT